jgi:osmotically-inducible protein OsmY
MQTDRDLQENVLAALDWEPELDAAQIGVSVSDGIVTLRGIVTTAHQKWTAERVTRHVIGVRAVANDLDVSPTGHAARSDPAIAEAAADALEWDSAVPDRAIKVTVRNGWVTLTGSVAHRFEKSAAERAVGRVYGVRGVANSVLVKSSVSPSDVKARIEEVLKRSALIDAQRIRVEASDGAVVLTGTVRSLAERDDAERAAWAAPGVTKVDDRLVVAF